MLFFTSERGARLRQLRLGARLTLAELAKRVGVSLPETWRLKQAVLEVLRIARVTRNLYAHYKAVARQVLGLL